MTHDYAHIKDPTELWQALKEWFDNQRDITLPHALDEWKNMRFQDFEKIGDYNSTMLRIVSQLRYYEKDITEAEMLDKTYLTFYKEHCVLQEIYRNCKFSLFSQLIVALQVAEQNNKLLIKNHNCRPTGIKTFLEINAMDVKSRERKNQPYHGHGRGRGCRSNCGSGRTYNSQGERLFKCFQFEGSQKGKEPQINSPKKCENHYFRFGSNGHWSHVCCTPKHLCKLYQESIKEKKKEVNLAEHFDGTSCLNSSDFDETTHADDERAL